jgi:hypothetical protein
VRVQHFAERDERPHDLDIDFDGLSAARGRSTAWQPLARKRRKERTVGRRGPLRCQIGISELPTRLPSIESKSAIAHEYRRILAGAVAAGGEIVVGAWSAAARGSKQL